MFSKNIRFENFLKKKVNKNFKEIYKNLISKKNDNNDLINSFTKSYSYSFNKELLKKYKKYNTYQIYGMGGSSLGVKAIYDFLKSKIKKKFYFFDNLDVNNNLKKTKLKNLNIIISKSGNTLETIVNENIFSKGKKLFITENKNNYLRNYAFKLKSEIINHNNFIGGRYSVLSETGMLPALLMGLKPHKFKRLDNLINNKNFWNTLILNVSTILSFYNSNKTNSVILNYDESSKELFQWYQQLVAESLGKKSRGILPIISSMPKDNHSVMQLYLDGVKNNFFTFFFTKEDKSTKIFNSEILQNFAFLKNKNLNDIVHSQFIATQNVFRKKNIPFRSFIIEKKNEETLGELFTFFILETILIGKALKINPFNQPAVELIKKETNKILKKKY